MGHSIGEYSALVASSMVSFEDAMRLVHARGQLMAACSTSKDLGMVALKLSSPFSEFSKFFEEHSELQVDIAGINSSTQIVVSGLKTEIDDLVKELKSLIARSAPLYNVSHPFHSRYMKHARDHFGAELDRVQFHPPNGVVVSNVTGEPADHQEFPKLLQEQITLPVMWKPSIDHALTFPNVTFIEVGPKKVLSNLLRQDGIECKPLGCYGNH